MKSLVPTIEYFSWQPPVLSILNTPPVGIKGERYIVGTGTDDWAGQDNNIAWYDDAWYFITATEGMKTYNLDTGEFLVFKSGSWGTYLDDYLYLPGRVGGQTAYGGSNSTDNLTLYSNPYQDGWVNFGTMGRIADSYGQFQIGLPALPLSASPQFLVRGHISDPATGAFASFINSDNQNVLSAISYPNGLGGNARVVLIGDTPPFVDIRVRHAINETSDLGVASTISNAGTGLRSTTNLIMTNALSTNNPLDPTSVPTHSALFGQTGSAWADPAYTLFNADSGYAYTTDGDFFSGAGRGGNYYLFAGSITDKTAIKLSISGTNGNVGIGLGGSTLASFPLQVAGRARFNDSVGVDTDPSTFGLDLRGSLNFVATQPPTTTPTATLAGTPGNVDEGTHRYKVNYYTSLGDTNLSSDYTSSTIVSSTIDGQVILTNIPTSTDNKVIGRRIYRTKANQTAGYHLLTTIANNTTTTYTDNTADADLDSTTYDGLDNFTRGHIYLDGDDAGFFGNTNFGLGIGSLANGNKFTGGYNFALGTNSLNSLTSGKANAGLGASTLRSLTSGSYNTAIGYYSGYSLTTGNSNTVIGQSSLVSATTGYANSAIGVNTLNRLTEGSINVAVGSNSLHNLTTGHSNVGIGYASGYNNVTGTGNLFLGYFAGGNEMGSNKLYIANSNTSNPLIYGEFDNSYLKVNGKLNVTGDTYWTGSGSGIPYGHMTNDLGDTITITTQNVWVEANSTVWTAGLTNLVTFGGTHYLAVDKAGVYEVIISASISNAGINDTVGIAVMVNGTAQTAGHAQATLGTANTQSSLSTSYILNLSANDQISLGVVNHSGTTNLDLQHASITLKMIGG